MLFRSFYFTRSCHILKSASRFFSSRVFADKEAMMAGALEMAGEIAARSPVAVQGTKINLIYSRDHSVTEGLDYMVRTHTNCLLCLSHSTELTFSTALFILFQATWNMSMLQTQDVMKSAQAAMEKKSPKSVVFSKF